MDAHPWELGLIVLGYLFGQLFAVTGVWLDGRDGLAGMAAVTGGDLSRQVVYSATVLLNYIENDRSRVILEESS